MWSEVQPMHLSTTWAETVAPLHWMVMGAGEQSAGSSDGWTATNMLPVTYSWPQAERAPLLLISPMGVILPLKLARLLKGDAVTVLPSAARQVSAKVAVSFISRLLVSLLLFLLLIW